MKFARRRFSLFLQMKSHESHLSRRVPHTISKADLISSLHWNWISFFFQPTNRIFIQFRICRRTTENLSYRKIFLFPSQFVVEFELSWASPSTFHFVSNARDFGKAKGKIHTQNRIISGSSRTLKIAENGKNSLVIRFYSFLRHLIQLQTTDSMILLLSFNSVFFRHRYKLEFSLQRFSRLTFESTRLSNISSIFYFCV